MMGIGLTNGIEGYIHRAGGLGELLEGLRHLRKGAHYISPMLIGPNGISPPFESASDVHPSIQLTPQEERILKMVHTKKTNQEIAEILNISKRTVENHRQNMCKKLGLHGYNKLYEFSVIHFD